MPTPNDLSGAIWQLTYPDEAPVKVGPTIIRGVSWEGYSSSSHHAMLVDGRGRTVFEAFGLTSLQPITKTFKSSTQVWDLTLVDLDSGKLLVYV